MANLILAKTKPFDLANIFSTFITQWYYYVLLLAVIVAIIIFSVCKKSNRNTLSKTQNLVYTAVFTALAFVVNAFVSISISPWNTLSFTATIGFVSGYLLGGARGFAVAFIGVITFTLSAIGVKIGNVFGCKFKAKAELAGGVILILMGLKILLEHLEIINF